LELFDRQETRRIIQQVVPHTASEGVRAWEALPLGPEETKVEGRCTRCSHLISVQPGQRFPPWCPKCGTDLEEPKDAGPELQDSAAPDVARQEWVAKNLRERFTRHNLAVGLLLAAWGLFIGLRGQSTSLDKILAAEPALAILLTVLQWVMLANGSILFLSGLGLRTQRPWWRFLALTSAVLSILVGFVFFGVFWHLGTFQGLENSVARVTFVTTNLNLLGGLVDGFGLLVFLNLYRASVAPPGSPSPGTR
jgi:hypothetical protein